MTHPHDRQDELTATERQAQIAMLMVAGVRDQRTLADKFGVNQSTISRDIRKIETEWKKQTLIDFEKAKSVDLMRIDEGLKAVMPQVKKGHLSAVDRMVSLLKRRADIFGYDSPKRTENTHTGADGAPLTVSVVRIHEPESN